MRKGQWKKIYNYEPCDETVGRFVVVVSWKSFSKSRASNAVSSVSEKKKKLKQSDLKADPQAWNKDRCFWFLCEILILETWSTIITYTIRNMYDSFFIEI